MAFYFLMRTQALRKLDIEEKKTPGYPVKMWSDSCLKNCGHANNIYGFTRPVVYHNHIQYKHSLQCHFVGNKTWMKIERFISGHIMYVGPLLFFGYNILCILCMIHVMYVSN